MERCDTEEQAFQPTLPARGATRAGDYCKRIPLHFNPRSPHGERHVEPVRMRISAAFQPTLPARGATSFRCQKPGCHLFQPTLPARGATPVGVGAFLAKHISTHAPRTGSDIASFTDTQSFTAFQPTLPARGATRQSAAALPAERFQPTLPARGATGARSGRRRRAGYFNPRSPHGERLAFCDFSPAQARFQPTLPARGATLFDSLPAPVTAYFTPRSPHGERHVGHG